MATPLTVYPNARYVSGVLTSLTVLAADGETVIPQNGASVDYELQYYKNLLAQGELVTASPFLPSGPPIDLVIPTLTVTGTFPTSGQVLAFVSGTDVEFVDPQGGIADGTRGLLTNQLTLPGETDGATVRTVGYSVRRDGGGATFTYAAGVSSGADAYTRINVTGGQWQMLDVEEHNIVDPRWFGAKFDGLLPDHVAIQAALNAVPAGGRLQCPRGRALIGACLLMKTRTEIRGYGCAPVDDCDTVLVYVGTPGAGSCIIKPKRECHLEQLELTPADGVFLEQCEAIDWYDGMPNTNVTHRRVLYYGRRHGDTPTVAGRIDYGVTIGHLVPTTSNLEFMKWDDCRFANFEVAGAYFNGAQPYGTRFSDCGWGGGQMASFKHPGMGYTCYGTAVLFGTSTMSCSFVNPNWSSVEVIWECTLAVGVAGGYAGPFFVSAENVDSEHCARLLHSSGTSPNKNTCWTVKNARFDLSSTDRGPRFAANDGPYLQTDGKSWIRYYNGGPIHLDGIVLADDIGTYNVWIEVAAHTPVTVDACSFAVKTPDNGYPIWRTLAGFGGSPPNSYSGGSFGRGCKVAYNDFTAHNDLVFKYLRQLNGPENSGGEVTLLAANTFVDVTLLRPEIDTTYQVFPEIQTVAGAVATGSFYISNKTTTGFRINRTAAPGSNVVIAYRMELLV